MGTTALKWVKMHKNILISTPNGCPVPCSMRIFPILRENIWRGGDRNFWKYWKYSQWEDFKNSLFSWNLLARSGNLTTRR